MNTVMERKSQTIVVVPSGITELVRGSDLRLVGYVEPLVRSQDVMLDFSAIERIDAAGIAALIALYGTARSTGHSFRLCDVRKHVSEVLALVGLEHILVGCTADWNSPVRGTLAQTAA
jgi:anti-anti-sigma factor